jgi:hypothetical protein
MWTSSGRGRLSHASHAGKDVGLGDPVVLDGVLQGLDHGLLADELVESLRPVLPGEDLV